MQLNYLWGSLFLGALVKVGQAQSIIDALSDKPDLSLFLGFLQTHPAVLDALSGPTRAPKTVFVPNDKAIRANSALGNLTIAEQQATLRYHILNGTYEAGKLGVKGGTTLQTLLEVNEFALLGGGGNVIFSSAFGDDGEGAGNPSTQVFTGLGQQSTILTTDLKFDGGLVHVVDNVFSLPRPCTVTAQAAGLNSLNTALQRANLTTYVDNTERITCFAPSDAAFTAAGNPETKLSKEDLAKALAYHTLQGEFVGYSDLWKDGQEFLTLSGDKIRVGRNDSGLFLNNVKVVKANVITSNGVAHVLAGVLSPPKNDSGNGNTTKPDDDDNGAPGIASDSRYAVAVVAAVLAYLFL